MTQIHVVSRTITVFLPGVDVREEEKWGYDTKTRGTKRRCVDDGKRVCVGVSG